MRGVAAPAGAALAAELGRALPVWDGILAAIEEAHGPVMREWRPSKSAFGSMCLLKRGKRTLLHLTPGKGKVVAAVVLGERAAAAALAGALPERIKTLLREARPYAEGRGIRFQVVSAAQIPTVRALVAAKLAGQGGAPRTRAPRPSP